LAHGRFWASAVGGRLYGLERYARADRQGLEPARRAEPRSTVPQPSRGIGAPLTPAGILYLQRAAGNLTVSRLLDPVADTWIGEEPPPTAAPELSAKDIVDAETSAIADTVRRFREVQVTVQGPPEQVAIPWSDFDAQATGMKAPTITARRSKTLTVHSAYFINTDTAKAAYRTEASFTKVAKALQAKSLVEYDSGKPYSVGMAVRVGKSTPSDVQAFVEEAAEEGLVKTYAHATDPFKHQFPAGKTELVDLPETTLHDVIQQWVIDKGVGVDCSGFVLQAAVAVREKIHAVAKEKGMAVPADYQGDIAHTERSAASFASGTARSAPTDIRLGDAWVIGTTHVRIVASTPVEADGQVQFDADESQGDSTHTAVGPTSHTWRTHSKTAFNPMLRLKEGGDPLKKADYEQHGQGNHHFYAIS